MSVLAADVVSHLAFVDEGVEGLEDEEWMGDDWAAHEALKAGEDEEEGDFGDFGDFEGYGDFEGDFEDCD